MNLYRGGETYLAGCSPEVARARLFGASAPSSQILVLGATSKRIKYSQIEGTRYYNRLRCSRLVFVLCITAAVLRL